MNPPIARLPNELLIQILLKVHVGSSPNLSSCLPVCHRWYDIGISILYEDVVLKNRNLGLFTASCKTTHAELVRSLTLNIGIQGGHFPGPPVSLQSLPAMLRRMTGLKMFSLAIGGFHGRNESVRDILKALPRALEGLEIQIQILSQDTHVHICDSTSGLIPNIRYLCLRLPSICPLLMGKLIVLENSLNRLKSSLRYALIHIGDKRNLEALCCSQYEAPPSVRDLDYLKPTGSHYVLGTTLRKLYLEGAFPEAKAITLLGRLAGSAKSFNPLNYDTFNVRNVCQNNTLSIPHCEIEESENLVMVRTPEGEELIGSLNDVYTLAEGEGSWKTSSIGSRFPAASEVFKRKKDDGWTFEEGSLVSKEAFQAKSKSRLALWGREETVGQKLLHARLHDGIDHTILSREIIPFDWKLGMNGLIPD